MNKKNYNFLKIIKLEREGPYHFLFFFFKFSLASRYPCHMLQTVKYQWCKEFGLWLQQLWSSSIVMWKKRKENVSKMQHQRKFMGIDAKKKLYFFFILKVQEFEIKIIALENNSFNLSPNSSVSRGILYFVVKFEYIMLMFFL